MLEAFLDAHLSHNNLTVFPVTAAKGTVLPYLLSTEVEGKGILTVRERGDSETPMLLVRNNSLHPLLVLAGEPLPDEHRGRVVSRSFLLGGKSVTQIPASAMERGGWVSPDKENEITEWMEWLPRVKHQIGILAFLGEEVMGLEALGAPNLYEAVHRRLLVRFIKGAMKRPDVSPGDPPFLRQQAQRLLDSLRAADRTEATTMGLGEFWGLNGSVRGGELLDQGQLVHLSVEPVPAGSIGRPGERE
jgi:hypothetical protein